MPTYEFTCPDGHDFDKFFRSMASAPTVVPCPVCGKPADRQMSAGAGLVFHGSGFYITDYGKDGKKDQKSATGRKSESAPAAEGGATGSSESSDSGAKASEPRSDQAASTSGPESKPETRESSAVAPAEPAKPAKPASTPTASE